MITFTYLNQNMNFRPRDLYKFYQIFISNLVFWNPQFIILVNYQIILITIFLGIVNDYQLD